MADSQIDTSTAENAIEQEQSALAPGELVLGTLADIDAEGRPLVDYPINPASSPLVAITTVAVNRSQINRQVALMFAEGDCHKPIIAGFIHSPLYSILESYDENYSASAAGEHESTSDQEDQPHSDELSVAHVDGDRVIIEGKNEVVLKCGEASITLTRAGKVLIRGKYLLNRSSGVNRILGGSVQVN